MCADPWEIVVCCYFIVLDALEIEMRIVFFAFFVEGMPNFLSVIGVHTASLLSFF